MKTTPSSLSILRALWCLLLAAPSTQAFTYYVATTGNDANPGTQAQPFRTIQRAITHTDTTKFHTLIVAAGVYAENIIWTNRNLAVLGAGVGASIIDGGGVGTCLSLANVPSTASLEGFTIRNGRANNASDNTGGGMHNQRSKLLVSRCTFANNSALFDGGGMFNRECTNLTLIACTFTNNSCGRDGGGMENWSSRLLLFSCLFMNNSSTNNGGGMDNFGGSSPSLIHCTFNGNRATTGGGVNTSDGTGPTLTNCIIWGNAGGEVAGAATVSHSDVLGGYAGIGNLNADPLFVSTASGNCRLQGGSLCIDAGLATVVSPALTDLDGVARLQGSGPDLGAYEFGSWFVDKTSGSDINPGDRSAPFATVTRANTVAANGHSLYVKQGNYGSDRPRITKALRLFNWGGIGLARIGQP